MSDGHVEQLIAVLRSHHRASAGRDDPPAASASASALHLSLSNAAALDLPIGDIVAAFVATRMRLAPRLRTDIAAAVGEAVVNAVVHGNLAMTNQGRDAFAWIDLRQEIEARLADSTVIAKRCEIRVRWTAAAILVRISDHGAGFVPGAAMADDALPWGRGIRIMRALASRCRWTRGGRSLLLRFAR